MITKREGRFIVRRDTTGHWGHTRPSPQYVTAMTPATRERFGSLEEAKQAVEQAKREDEAAMLRLGLGVLVLVQHPKR